MAFATTRRQWVAGMLTAVSARALPRPAGLLIDTHIHLFAADQKRFPFHPNAPYKPQPQTLEDYAAFVGRARIDRAVIVHPEPYQDDHRYLEYCFAHEPSPGFFKGTCLFDPTARESPTRMEALVRKHPKRIVALRVHQMREGGQPATREGAIKERDLGSREMAEMWKKAQTLGLAIQMHFVPAHAPSIYRLASGFKGLPIVLDHLGRPGQGTPAQYKDVLRLAKLPGVYMKFSAVRYASKQAPPYADVKPVVRQVYQAFGPGRIIWGGLGMNMADFEQQIAIFDSMFDYVSEKDRARIRGENAARLYGFNR